MLAAAFAAAATAAVTGSPWLALAAAMATSLALALLHGFACITHRGNHVVSGVAINILASGSTIVLGVAWFAQGGQTPLLSGEARFRPLIWPGTETLGAVPLLGTLYRELVSGHNLLVYVALAVVPLTWWIVRWIESGSRVAVDHGLKKGPRTDRATEQAARAPGRR